MERHSCRWTAIRCSVMFSEQLLGYKFGGLERKRFVEEGVTTEGFRGLGRSFCKYWVIASVEERYLQGSANVLAFISKGLS
jgi:hypothetical protein